MMCVTCVNNTPPVNQHDDLGAAHEEEIQFGDFDDITTNIYNIAPITNDGFIYVPIDPPIDTTIQPVFDMNAASSVEHLPDYMNDLLDAQLEYNGLWYFALDNQIYSVPYEIEIDDNYVRQDIVSNWDGVEWAGTIFGEYVAWR
jgi:hypothetical protein